MGWGLHAHSERHYEQKRGVRESHLHTYTVVALQHMLFSLLNDKTTLTIKLIENDSPGYNNRNKLGNIQNKLYNHIDDI